MHKKHFGIVNYDPYWEKRGKTRAERAGSLLGRAIIEMVHLMYQKNTALNFLKGLKASIDKEFLRRKGENHQPRASQ